MRHPELRALVFILEPALDERSTVEKRRLRLIAPATPHPIPSPRTSSYEYSLRHLYGLEGKRKACDPQSCSKVHESGLGSGEGGLGHGCPFASAPRGSQRSEALKGSEPSVDWRGSAEATHGSPNTYDLVGMLSQQGLTAGDIEDILAPVVGANGGFVVDAGQSGGIRAALKACRRHLVTSHRGKISGGIFDERVGAGDRMNLSPNLWLAVSTSSYSGRYMIQDVG